MWLSWRWLACERKNRKNTLRVQDAVDMGFENSICRKRGFQPNTGFDVASPISRHLGSLAKNEHLLNSVSSYYLKWIHRNPITSQVHNFLEASPQSKFKSTPRYGAGSVRRFFSDSPALSSPRVSRVMVSECPYTMRLGGSWAYCRAKPPPTSTKYSTPHVRCKMDWDRQTSASDSFSKLVSGGLATSKRISKYGLRRGVGLTGLAWGS
jgi:hypothetical protein